MPSIILLVLAWQAHRAHRATEGDIAYWRDQFERVMKDYPLPYINVESEMLGPVHSEAYYPVGSAAERFILVFEGGNGGNAGTLLYQRRHGDRTSVDWAVPFRKLRRKRTFKGTMLKYLALEGYELSPRVHLSTDQRRKLARSGCFARYLYHPEEGSWGNVVYPDGRSSTLRKNLAKFSVTPEEKKLLGL